MSSLSSSSSSVPLCCCSHVTLRHVAVQVFPNPLAMVGFFHFSKGFCKWFLTQTSNSPSTHWPPDRRPLTKSCVSLCVFHDDWSKHKQTGVVFFGALSVPPVACSLEITAVSFTERCLGFPISPFLQKLAWNKQSDLEAGSERNALGSFFLVLDSESAPVFGTKSRHFFPVENERTVPDPAPARWKRVPCWVGMFSLCPGFWFLNLFRLLILKISKRTNGDAPQWNAISVSVLVLQIKAFRMDFFLFIVVDIVLFCVI